MSRAWCGRSLLNSSRKSSNFALLLQAVQARGAGGFRFKRKVHALVPAILLRMTRSDAFDGDAQAQPPDGELGEVEQRVGRGEGNAVVRTHAARQAALFKQALKGGKSKGFTGRFQSLAEKEIARGVVRNGQRVAVFFVAQQELAFVIGAP